MNAVVQHNEKQLKELQAVATDLNANVTGIQINLELYTDVSCVTALWDAILTQLEDHKQALKNIDLEHTTWITLDALITLSKYF